MTCSSISFETINSLRLLHMAEHAVGLRLNTGSKSTKDTSLVHAVGLKPETGSESAKDACAGELGRLGVSGLHNGMM